MTPSTTELIYHFGEGDKDQKDRLGGQTYRVGGEWDFVMHGPDGTDYTEWISWTGIAPPERITLPHGESRGDPNAFESVLTFEPDGVATRIQMRTVFPSKELREEAVEK